MFSEDDDSSQDRISRRRSKRAASENDSDEELDLNFFIMEITRGEVQVGSSTRYIVLDDDCREHQKSFKEIELVAKKQGGPIWEQFVEWATSKGLYKSEYKKHPPKPKALPQKRERKQFKFE